MFDDPNWTMASGIKPDQIPLALKTKMTDVTATLKKFYQKGPPENVLDVSRALSEQFSVPLPATSKFAESVHKAYLEYSKTHAEKKGDKKKIVFKLRKKGENEGGKERVFRKVRIIIRGDDGQEITAEEWRRQFWKKQDFNDFRFKTLKDRFMQLDSHEQAMKYNQGLAEYKSSLKGKAGVMSDAMKARLMRFGGLGKFQNTKGQSGEGGEDYEDEDIVEEDDGNGRKVRKRKGAGGKGRLGKGGSGDKVEEGAGDDDNAGADDVGLGRARHKGEGEGDDDDEGYDYGIVQTIVMDTRGNVLHIEERIAEEGEVIDTEQGDFDGRDENFKNKIHDEEDEYQDAIDEDEFIHDYLNVINGRPPFNPAKHEYVYKAMKIDGDDAGDIDGSGPKTPETPERAEQVKTVLITDDKAKQMKEFYDSHKDDNDVVELDALSEEWVDCPADDPYCKQIEDKNEKSDNKIKNLKKKMKVTKEKVPRKDIKEIIERFDMMDKKKKKMHNNQPTTTAPLAKTPDQRDETRLKLVKRARRKMTPEEEAERRALWDKQKEELKERRRKLLEESRNGSIPESMIHMMLLNEFQRSLSGQPDDDDYGIDLDNDLMNALKKEEEARKKEEEEMKKKMEAEEAERKKKEEEERKKREAEEAERKRKEEAERKAKADELERIRKEEEEEEARLLREEQEITDAETDLGFDEDFARRLFDPTNPDFRRGKRKKGKKGEDDDEEDGGILGSKLEQERYLRDLKFASDVTGGGVDENGFFNVGSSSEEDENARLRRLEQERLKKMRGRLTEDEDSSEDEDNEEDGAMFGNKNKRKKKGSEDDDLLQEQREATEKKRLAAKEALKKENGDDDEDAEDQEFMIDQKLAAMTDIKGNGEDALDRALKDLDPYLKAEQDGRDRLKSEKDKDGKKASDVALRRAGADEIAKLYANLRDLSAMSDELLKETNFLVASALIEVELKDQKTMLKEKRERMKKRNALDNADVNDLSFLNSTHKPKVLKEIDEVIKNVIDQLKDALTKLNIRSIYDANSHMIVLFVNRNVVTKIKLLIDEDLIRLIFVNLDRVPQRCYLELLTTLALLSRKPENRQYFLKYKIIPDLSKRFLAPMGDRITLPFSEAICYLSTDTTCRTEILKQDKLVKKILVVYKQVSQFDKFATMYFTGFLYNISQSVSDMQHIIKNEGVKNLVDVLKKHLNLREDIVRLLIGTINNLCRDKATCVDFIQRFTITYVIQIIKAQLDQQPQVIRFCLSFLMRSMEQIEGRKALIAELASAVPVLVSVINKFLGIDEECVKNSSNVLFFYASQSPNNIETIVKASAVDALCSVIAQHQTLAADTLEGAVGTLSLLVINNKDSRNQVSVSKYKVVPMIGFLLNKYAKNQSKLSESLCGVVYGLGFIPPNITLIGGLMATPSIITAIQTWYKNNPVLVRYALGALSQLMSNSAFVPHFFQADGLTMLDEVFNFYLGLDPASFPIPKEDDDRRNNLYRGEQDITDIFMNGTSCMTYVGKAMTDDQAKQYRKFNIVPTLMEVGKKYLTISQGVIENACVALVNMRVPHGAFSDLKTLIGKGKKQWPQSRKLDM